MSIVDQMPLFATPDPPPPLAVPTPARTPAGRHRQLLLSGRHPATRTPMHPDAPRVAAAVEPAPGPRCGDCVHLQRTETASGRRLWSCLQTPFVADMRRWWPACHLFERNA